MPRLNQSVWAKKSPLSEGHSHERGRLQGCRGWLESLPVGELIGAGGEDALPGGKWGGLGPEETPIEVGGKNVEQHGNGESRAEAVAHLDPAADRGRKGPTETVRHAYQAGDGGAVFGADYFPYFSKV